MFGFVNFKYNDFGYIFLKKYILITYISINIYFEKRETRGRGDVRKDEGES